MKPLKDGEIRLMLASSSPRRADLLRLTGWQFELCPVDLDETADGDASAEVLVRRLALAKAEGALRARPKADLVLAADTLVVDRDSILGKPLDEQDARRMLMALRGRNHRVVSALVLKGMAGEQAEICETVVPMRNYTRRQVDAYVESGRPLDKAGAYGIQGRAGRYVTRVEGCYFNVVGLPLARLYAMLREMEWQEF